MFGTKDVDEIIGLGYSIVGARHLSLAGFIQHHLPGFDLLKLLKVVEQFFTPTSKTSIHKVIAVDSSNKSLEITYKNTYTGEDDALLFVRRFIIVQNEVHIYHDYCIIPKKHRNRGLVKPVFQESLRQYQNMQASKILVHAALSGGGYVWAKHGFVATDKIEVDYILEQAHLQLSETEFSDVEVIYNGYYKAHPNGTRFPMLLWAAMDCMKSVLLKSNWNGELDLTNPKELSNFKNYVFR